ncbi:spore protein involved in the shaping of the spore coat [[Clostridium] ultunense Esp]|uniref:sporulation protein YabP n=1 Tax=Thermicanus aegyptius TaxID=94009 RepID=UPI0002B703CA|nr:sporulation protein YabP [Thermicanus aegyptius]CCQ93447.1 spore protein involved in the shaping of the spore coat [[Clostridium] ultunense Esp]
MAEKTVRHEINLFNRKSLSLSGVKKVESFDSEEFLLETEMGYLLVKGENLHLRNLSVEAGEVAIEGKIKELGYLDQYEPGVKVKGFFGKLFK